VIDPLTITPPRIECGTHTCATRMSSRRGRPRFHYPADL